MIKTSAAGGQHEVHLVLRSPVNPVRDALWQDVVNKNSTEPKIEMPPVAEQGSGSRV